MSSSGGEPEADRMATVVGAVGLNGQKIRFQLLFFTQFVAASGFIVFRNVYLEEMGLSGAEMGVIGFLMLATGVAVQPFWGGITDYLRVERAVLVVGAVVSALALLSYLIGDGLTNPFLVVALGTAVFSAFRAPLIPIATGMVLSRGYAYGTIRGFGSLAFAIGSLGFGFLVAGFGIPVIVYFYLVGMAVFVAVVWSLSDTSSVANTDVDTDELSLSRAVRALVTNRTFVVVLTVMFLLRLSFMGGEAFLSVYMRAMDVHVAIGSVSLSPDALTGIAWAINAGIEAVAFVYAIRLELPYKWLLVVGGTAVVIPNLVYGITTQPWAILAVQLLGGIGFALLTLAAVNLVHTVATTQVKSSAQTLLSGAGLGLGGAVGQLVAGVLVDAVGLQRMYVLIAAIGFVGAAVGLLITHHGRLDGHETTV
ncbi:MAG TPA: MFS transporter [Halococcus sp.]|nr:MFS transporter [Halococcus sp.]